MKYLVRTPLILSERGVCSLLAVAQAMASRPATAGAKRPHGPTYEYLLVRYSDWLLEMASNGQLKLSDSAGIPQSGNEITNTITSNINTPIFSTSQLWVTLHQLSSWGAQHGLEFEVLTENVPWIDERGIQGIVYENEADLIQQSRSTKGTPIPLTSREISECFAGLKWKDASAWKKALAKKPGWLKECIVIPGQQGKSAIRWNPVLIAAKLVIRWEVGVRSARAVFQRNPTLSHWRSIWDDYEEDNFGTD